MGDANTVLVSRVFSALDAAQSELQKVATGKSAGHRFFHVAHMRNALDHTVQPDVVVDSLLRVMRPGGVLVLRHFENVHHAEWRSLSSGLCSRN